MKRRRQLKPGSREERDFADLCERLGLGRPTVIEARDEKPAERQVEFVCVDCGGPSDDGHSCVEQTRANRRSARESRKDTPEAPF